MSTGGTLEYFLIEKKRLRDWRFILLYAAVLVFMVVYSITNGMRVGMASDFNVFWNAGKNFASGADMYSRVGGAERYIYPPFAAMLFQFFALFPLKMAASIYTFINFLLFLLSISLTRKILEYFIADYRKRDITIAIIFGVVCSFRFFWYHTAFVQMNELMLVLCLYGILASLKGREWVAVACIIVAAFIKVLPVFFIPWLLLRGNYKTFFKLAFCTAVCLLMPWLWRGGYTGITDLHNYYSSFLEPFQNGRVEPEFHNQSLAASMYKICLPNAINFPYNYQLFNLSISQASLIYKISFFLIGGLLLGYLAWEKFVLKKNTLRELALIFIAMHLLSGITWEYHLVSLLFVYAVYALYFKQKMTPLSKFFFYLIGFFIVLFSIVGKDTVGDFLYHYMEGYSVVTWTMVMLFFFLLFMKEKKEILVR